jgi:hypothetical protein
MYLGMTRDEFEAAFNKFFLEGPFATFANGFYVNSMTADYIAGNYCTPHGRKLFQDCLRRVPELTLTHEGSSEKGVFQLRINVSPGYRPRLRAHLSGTLNDDEEMAHFLPYVIQLSKLQKAFYKRFTNEVMV